ncbi:MAG: hypothetical protein R2692_06290 [Microbacterium sp.]
MQEHVTTGAGGAALAGLVALLRERGGYLSHALTDTQTAWMTDTGVDTFVPSAAGARRIDQLFTALLDREQDPRAQASATSSPRSATAGSSRSRSPFSRVSSGFPPVSSSAPARHRPDRARRVSERVVRRSRPVGLGRGAQRPRRVDSGRRDRSTCRRAEPRGHGAADPAVGTEVRPDTVGGRRRSPRKKTPPPEQQATLDLSWLWTALRTTGASCSPWRHSSRGPSCSSSPPRRCARRSRRTADDPRECIAGGWDNTSTPPPTPAGAFAPGSATRVEIAQTLDAPVAARLAAGADAAVFSAEPTTPTTTRPSSGASSTRSAAAAHPVAARARSRIVEIVPEGACASARRHREPSDIEEAARRPMPRGAHEHTRRIPRRPARAAQLPCSPVALYVWTALAVSAMFARWAKSRGKSVGAVPQHGDPAKWGGFSPWLVLLSFIPVAQIVVYVLVVVSAHGSTPDSGTEPA